MKLTLQDNKVIKQHSASLPFKSFGRKRVLNAIIHHESHVITSKFFSFIAFPSLSFALCFILSLLTRTKCRFSFAAASDNVYSERACDRRGCWMLTSNVHERRENMKSRKIITLSHDYLDERKNRPEIMVYYLINSLQSFCMLPFLLSTDCVAFNCVSILNSLDKLEEIIHFCRCHKSLFLRFLSLSCSLCDCTSCEIS